MRHITKLCFCFKISWKLGFKFNCGYWSAFRLVSDLSIFRSSLKTPSDISQYTTFFGKYCHKLLCVHHHRISLLILINIIFYHCTKVTVPVFRSINIHLAYHMMKIITSFYIIAFNSLNNQSFDNFYLLN